MSSFEHRIEPKHKMSAMETQSNVDAVFPKRKKRLAKVGLEGFMIMEMVESKWEETRQELQSRIIDQPAAIDAIIDALDGSEVRLSSDNRPIANFAFLGPTGVGKSETAKVLAELLGEGETNLVKIDCSNFSNGHEIGSLIGAPAGYVGYCDEPILSKKRVERPGTVLLFDEIEKGSDRLYSLMLQIMGDGELELNNGGNVSFRDTVVIITSNLGAKEMASRMMTPLGFGSMASASNHEDIERVATKAFDKHFRPEFNNRLDKMVVFHPLTESGLQKILDTKLAIANDEYEKRYGVIVTLSDATKAHLVSLAAKDSHLGARPLVRALEKNIQSTFGRYISSGSVREGTHIKVMHRNEIPLEYSQSSDETFIFTSRPDISIRRELEEISPIVSGEVVLYEDDVVPEEDV